MLHISRNKATADEGVRWKVLSDLPEEGQFNFNIELQHNGALNAKISLLSFNRSKLI